MGVFARRLCIVSAFLLLAACQDDPANPPVTEQPDTAASNLFQARISEPTGTGGPGVANAQVLGLVYVAFSAGELGDARSARITNLSAGLVGTTEYAVEAGALDPVAVPANVGDTLELRLTNADGTTAAMRATVPKKRPPRIIRTNPPKGRTDVAVNSRVIVIFSEPVDTSTVTNSTIRLTRAGQNVAGRFFFGRESALVAEFIPTQSLSPSSTYTLAISSDIRDLSGDPLEQPLTATFVTGIGSESSTNLRVTTTTTGDDLPAGFLVSVSGGEPRTIAANGGVTFTNLAWVKTLGVTGHYVQLSGLPDHCSAGTGNSRFAALGVPGVTVEVSFPIQCQNLGPVAWVTSQKIAFVRGDDIFAVDPDGTNEVRLTDIDGSSEPAWAPDGNRLAFVSTRNNRSAIYVTAANGPVRTRLEGNRPSWSPDGLRVAFSALREGQFEIHTASVHDDGSIPVHVVSRPGVNVDPAWSPDGRQIAFVSDWVAYDFVYDIYVATVGDTTVSQLTNGFGFWPNLFVSLHPAWSPDGKRIAFVYSKIINATDVRFTVAVMTPGGMRTDLAWAGDINWMELQDPGSLAWSPDGSKIAFTFVDCNLTPGASCPGVRRIKYVTADGRQQGIIAPVGHSPSWRR